MCTTATLVVLIVAPRQPSPVFLHHTHTTTISPSLPQRVAEMPLQVTGAVRRAGDVVYRLVAIDIDRPRLPVTYRLTHDTVQSRLFDVETSSGVMTLTSNTSLLRGVMMSAGGQEVVNVTVEAEMVGGHSKARTLVQFELVDDHVAEGLVWHCDNKQVASVTENSEAHHMSVATLTAWSSVDGAISYHIISSQPAQHVFNIDHYTVCVC